MNLAQQRYTRLLNDLDRWVAAPENDRRVDWSKALRKALNGGAPQALAVAAVQLWFWANWHAQHGLKTLIDGDSAGWDQLHLSVEYRWLHQRLNPQMTMPAETALLLAHARTSGLDDRATWLANRVRANRAEDRLWEYCHFGAFQLTLPGAGVQELALSDTEIGVYAALATTWTGPAADVSTALVPACDYHLHQATTQDGYPDFDSSPFLVWPVEVVLINRLRADRGLDPVTVDHPLTSIPILLTPPPFDPRIEDPDVLRLIARAQDDGAL